MTLVLHHSWYPERKVVWWKETLPEKYTAVTFDVRGNPETEQFCFDHIDEKDKSLAHYKHIV